jgi:hypothetical protein
MTRKGKFTKILEHSHKKDAYFWQEIKDFENIKRGESLD